MNLRIKALLGMFAVMGGIIVSTLGVNANPLHMAMRVGDLEKVKELCGVYPEWVNERDDVRGRTPLLFAVRRKNGI